MDSGRSIKRTTFCGEINTTTGFGQHSIAIVSSLAKAGYFVSIRPFTAYSAGEYRVPEWILSQFVKCPQPEPIELVLSPLLAERWPTPERATIYYTMWESTKLRKDHVKMVNAAEHVIVPCKWCKQAFSESGVRKPISIVNLGVIQPTFNPTPVPRDGMCVFGAAGNLKNGSIRKGVGDVVTAFTRAFPKNHDVMLRIKCTPGDEVKAPADSRIQVTQAWMTDEKLSSWYKTLTCFVSAARAEAWGLMQMQAMSCGRPVIAAPYAGLSEFMNDENSFTVSFKEEDAGEVWTDCGKWCKPSIDEMIAHMRTIYNNRQIAIDKGAEAAMTAGRYSWDTVNYPLVSLLEDAQKIGN